jgi:hypothetical protein
LQHHLERSAVRCRHNPNRLFAADIQQFYQLLDLPEQLVWSGDDQRVTRLVNCNCHLWLEVASRLVALSLGGGCWLLRFSFLIWRGRFSRSRHALALLLPALLIRLTAAAASGGASDPTGVGFTNNRGGFIRTDVSQLDHV